ncbi:hypothetical protein CLV67_14416 [Actinoplanes italicus]|uniref:Uncharacterized protein n=1 Tax=Actinoplanes italicus TaxID=113567 RepID=A0A2T0JF06_9ACTN|nr:hypothetical protein CLV67_14416 [Actinoplanes italicus]
MDCVEWVIAPDGSPVALSGDTILRAWSPEELLEGQSDTPDLEIDLDAPINTMNVDRSGAVIVGTDHRLARLHLRRLPGRPTAG